VIARYDQRVDAEPGVLAALIGCASLVAAGFDVVPATFQRTLERLLDPPAVPAPLAGERLSTG
jgi:hypothetical protein